MNPKADLPGDKLQVQKELVKKKKSGKYMRKTQVIMSSTSQTDMRTQEQPELHTHIP